MLKIKNKLKFIPVLILSIFLLSFCSDESSPSGPSNNSISTAEVIGVWKLAGIKIENGDSEIEIPHDQLEFDITVLFKSDFTVDVTKTTDGVSETNSFLWTNSSNQIKTTSTQKSDDFLEFELLGDYLQMKDVKTLIDGEYVESLYILEKVND